MLTTTTLGLTGGFNTDLDNAFLGEGIYRMATNFTATSSDGSTLGALENVKGNKLLSEIDFGVGQVVIGYSNVVDSIVFFTSNGVDLSNIFLYSDGVLTTKYVDTGNTLNFSLDPDYRIVAVGRRETGSLEKVYWVDALNELRYINLSRDYEVEGAPGTYVSSEVFNVIPSNDITSTIDTEVINGGGLYNSGTVYHAYQLYSKNGTASTLSQGSFPTKLSEFSTIKDGGTPKGESTGNSVKVIISDILPELLDIYDRIRLYAIYYDNTASPVINIVDERELATTTISILDTGDIIGEITNAEFATLKQVTYVPKAIESKNNNLFIGNLKETAFANDAINDWDARAYRFAGSGDYTYLDSADGQYTVRIYGGNVPNTFKVDAGASTYPGVVEGEDVPIEFDCVNTYNNIYSNSLSNRLTVASGGYKNIADGSEIGGEGLNVKYTFQNETRVIDSTLSVANQATKDYVTSNLSDEHDDGTGTLTKLIECETGEVYRIGIKFYNSKGQSSFVKWVGDVLWEEQFDDVDGKVVRDATNENYYNNVKVLKVELKDDDNQLDYLKAAGVTSWQVVRVKREDTDKSVRANGFLNPFELHDTKHEDIPSNTYLPRVVQIQVGSDIGNYNSSIVNPGQTIRTSLQEFKFISPETMYNNPDEKFVGSKIRVYNYIDGQSLTNDIDTFGSNVNQTLKQTGLKSLSGVAQTNLYPIEEYKYLDPSYPESESAGATTIGGIEIMNRCDYDFGHSNMAGACSSAALSINNGDQLAYPTTVVPNGLFYASIIQNRDSSRYGGVSYYDIKSNEFIPFSDVTPIDTTEAKGVYGDTYTAMYYYLYAMYDNSEAGADLSFQTLHAFPIQSSVDLRYREDRVLDFHTGVAETEAGENSSFLQETVARGIELFGTSYDTNIGDLYTYFPAYSVQNGSQPSFVEPFDFNDEEHITTKVLASEKKINGENEDSWTNFLSNNFIEVDTAYGALNDLKTMDQNLFFWQDKGFGRLAVNDRSLISDASGSQLSLGTGGVLERYDYISQEVGNVDKYSISKSEDSIYWTYSPKEAIYKFNGKLEELSTTRGINSYVKGSTVYLPQSVSDYKAKETLFQLSNGGEIIVYDWLSGSFTGTYTYYPRWFVPEFDGNILTLSNTYQVYRQNDDDETRGTFNGVPNDSTITLVCNKEYDQTKVFDTLNWHSTSTTPGTQSEGINLYLDTFDEYRIYNQYQNTDWQNIPIERKESSFTTYIPRDRVNKDRSDNPDIFSPSNLDDGTMWPKRRIRDKWINIDLKYTNKENTTFSIPYVNVGYRASIR